MKVKAWVWAMMAERLAMMPGILAMRGKAKHSSLKISEDVPRM